MESATATPAAPAPAPAVSETPVAPVVSAEVAKVEPTPTVEAKTEPEAPKPAEPAKVEPAKPEVVAELISKADQLKIPEKLGEAETAYLKSRLEAIAKSSIEGKVPLAEAQKALEGKLESFRDVAAYGDARLQAQRESWMNDIKNDPKLGGDNLNRTNLLAERALTTLFGKEFYDKELKNLYLTSHPEVVRGLVKFAEASGDATLTLGEKPVAPVKQLTPGQKVYGENYNPMQVQAQPKKY